MEQIEKKCVTCAFNGLSMSYEPCYSCNNYSSWQPDGCMDCIYRATKTKCNTCIDYSQKVSIREVETPVAKPKNPVQAVGLKFDVGKPPLSRIPREFLEQVARVLEFGANKYDWNNWRNGIQYHRLLDAAMRHLTAFADCETIDPESGLSHLAHAACCIAFLTTYEENPQSYKKFDDRFSFLREEIPEEE